MQKLPILDLLDLLQYSCTANYQSGRRVRVSSVCMGMRCVMCSGQVRTLLRQRSVVRQQGWTGSRVGHSALQGTTPCVPCGISTPDPRPRRRAPRAKDTPDSQEVRLILYSTSVECREYANRSGAAAVHGQQAEKRERSCSRCLSGGGGSPLVGLSKWVAVPALHCTLQLSRARWWRCGAY